MITFICYVILCPTPSESRELRLMPPFGARVPSRVDVCLCIIPIKPFLMVWFAPPTWASDRRVSAFNVEPARVTHIPVCERLCDVRVRYRLRCWMANYSRSAWCDRDTPVVVVATSTLSLRLVLQVVCERRALATSSAATLSASSSSSNLSSTSHVECRRHRGLDC